MSPAAPLPYMTHAQLIEQDGTLIQADVPLSIWPAVSQRDGQAGEAFDHVGEAPLGYAAQLAETNVSLVTGAGRYRVVEATPHTLLPHVALRLRRVRAGG